MFWSAPSFRSPPPPKKIQKQVTFLPSEDLDYFCQGAKQITVHKLILSPEEGNRTNFRSVLVRKNEKMDIQITCQKFLTQKS